MQRGGTKVGVSVELAREDGILFTVGRLGFERKKGPPSFSDKDSSGLCEVHFPPCLWTNI